MEMEYKDPSRRGRYIVIAGVILAAVAGGAAFFLINQAQQQVGQGELRLDDLPVAHRIDRSRDVHHVGILEAPQDVGDGVHFPDVGEEPVPQPLPLGGALHQAGDIHELNDRGDLGL